MLRGLRSNTLNTCTPFFEYMRRSTRLQKEIATDDEDLVT
jgi:hypothetical protein